MEDKKTSFSQALKFWFKLGFISFGGPAGQIAIMHRHLVEREKWISESRFMHALNYCMVLPGPEAQQLATYTGWLMHGTLGGLAAGILFVLPSMFILLGLSLIYVTYGQLPMVAGVFAALKPAVLAIVLLAMQKIGLRSLTTWMHYAMAALAFALIFFVDVPFPIIVVGAAVVGWFWSGYGAKASKNTQDTKPNNEAEYAINAQTLLPHTQPSWSRFVVQTLGVAALWCLPLLALNAWSDGTFWILVTGFFTKAALVTVGGAYSVLPYVAQVSVEKFHWLTGPQMLDGLALGETTPGPLVMVLAFVGFMGGYSHFGSSLIMGAVGLVVTTYYTFLPCFYFILAGAPVVEKTMNHARLKQMLSMISAAVVGVILNMSIYLGKGVLLPDFPASYLPDPIASAWLIISLVALKKFEIDMMKWIGITALFGLALALVGWPLNQI